MEEKISHEQPEEVFVELPYYKEDKIALPKDYDATIERITNKYEQKAPLSDEGKALFSVGIAVGAVLLFVQVLELFNYPQWLDWLHHIVIFGEALIPFAVSFFLKKPKHATIMRLLGIVVMLVYLYALFFRG